MIAGITLLATISVVSGVDKGIKVLSEINIVCAIALLLFVLFSGSFIAILNQYLENIGNYLTKLPTISFITGARSGSDWMGSWTIYYWGWWISWSPFVGMFIARISRGRTIREFIAGVLFVPTLFTFLWMTVFGETAFSIIRDKGDGLVTAINSNVSTSLFVFLEHLPLSSITAMLAIFFVFSFFVTSSDSGS